MSFDDLTVPRTDLLLQTLAAAVQQVPAYRPLAPLLQSAAPADALQLLRQFPLLDKPQLISGLDDYLSDAFPRAELNVAFTGGSTGEPLRFLRHPSEHPYEQRFRALAWRSFALTPQDRSVVLNVRPHPRSTDGVTFLAADGTLFLKMIDLRDEAIHSVYQRVVAHRPALLRGAGQLLLEFAHYCARHRLRVAGLRGVAYSTSVLLPSERRFVVEQLGVPLVSLYGQSERALMAIAEGHDQPFDIIAESGWIELIRADGSPIEQPGEVGEIVATPLFPRATALIRYRTGDLAAWQTVGRSLVDIDGRRAQVLVNRRGERTRLPTTVKDQMLRALPPAAQIQFVQLQAGRLTIRISLPYSAALQPLVAAAALEPDFVVDWAWATPPEIAPNGKRQLYVSQLAAAVDAQEH
jgi:phenylacetate-CoA ligase